MTILVDSDILIEVTRGRDQHILLQWAELGNSGSTVLYSPVSVAELWAGAFPQEHDVLNNLFRTLLCAAIDDDTGRQAGDYLRRYQKSHALEVPDALIAAGAVLRGAKLWTRNRKHYPMKDLSFY